MKEGRGRERERERAAAEVEMSFGRRNEDMERERMGKGRGGHHNCTDRNLQSLSFEYIAGFLLRRNMSYVLAWFGKR